MGRGWADVGEAGMIWFLVVLAAVVGWCVGFYHGVNLGVKETERRWSDAVGRKGGIA